MLVYVLSLLSLSTLVIKMLYLWSSSLRSHFVRELLYREIFYLQKLKEFRRPRRTNVPLHANRIVAVDLCQNHREKQFSWYPKKHGIMGISGGPSRPRKLALAIFPPEASWRFSQKVNPAVPLLMRSYLGMRKMSRPYEMGFSAWVKTDPETILKRHVVDAKGFYPAFREAPARKT